MTPTTRRGFVAGALGAPFLSRLEWDRDERMDPSPTVEAGEDEITLETANEATNLLGLEFSEQEKRHLVEGLRENRMRLRGLRARSLDNGLMPATVFAAPRPTKTRLNTGTNALVVPREPVDPITDDEDLAFRPITDLARLLRDGKVTSVQLTELCLSRLKEIGARLQCVVTLTEERALEEAKARDAELKSGLANSLLHGIPYGLKDLFATQRYPTTFGAKPFRDQVLDYESAVGERMTHAGAVLCAKLSLGSLAMGDLWFGGRTKNPWNLSQGSSGSSAGSSAAVAAGLLPFAIGTETLGSIVSPCTRCGVSGLRPTFGRVSRRGAMSLCYSMDKIGPIARSVRDLALVFDQLRQIDSDPADPSAIPAPFGCQARTTLKGYRIGYVPKEFDGEKREADRAVLDALRALDAELVEFQWPSFPVEPLRLILNVEASAAFEEFTRSGRVRELDGQERSDWPNQFRGARFVPAVEFVNAQRLRRRLVEELTNALDPVDAVVTPTFAGGSLLATNLSGHPACVIPIQLSKSGNQSISFIASSFDEGVLLEIAAAVQEKLDRHRERPPLS